MYFRQLIDDETDALGYLLGDLEERQAVAIDPQPRNLDLLLAMLAERDLHLEFVLRTQVRAEDAYGCSELRRRTGARLVAGRQAYCPAADRRVGQGDLLIFGAEIVRVLATPGQTAGAVSYLWQDRLFCGDAMNIGEDGECRPVDVAEFDAGVLYDSVTQHILTLPDETLIFPRRHVGGRTVSTVGAERRFNPCFVGRSREAFLTEMGARPAEPPQRRPAVQLAGHPHYARETEHVRGA